MKKIFIALFILISFNSIGQSYNNNQRVFNVKLFGARGDGLTDDTQAIQAAINAAIAKGGGDVTFPTGIYIISGALQTSVGGVNPNCQIYIPAAISTAAARSHVRLIGESVDNPQTGYLSGVIRPLGTKGVILRSTISGSGTTPSVISALAGAGGLESFSFNNLTVENISIQVYTNAGATAVSMTGINATFIATLNMRNVNINPDTALQYTASCQFSEVAGLITSKQNDRGPNTIENCDIEGFRYGIFAGEHTQFINTYIIGCWYGLVIQKGDHAVTGHVLIQACKHDIYIPNTTLMGLTSGTSYVDLIVESERITTSDYWYNASVDNVLDSGSNAHGSIRMNDDISNGGSGNSTVIKVLGNNIWFSTFDDPPAFTTQANAFTALQTITKTTEQLRLAYDAFNYASFTTSSTGLLTIAPTSGFVAITNTLRVPTVVGNNTTNGTLTLQSTAGVGASGADIIFKVGNNGGTEAMRILNSGFVGIGNNNPSYVLHVTKTLLSAPSTIENGVSFQITGAGSTSQSQQALAVNLLAGYTGSSATAAGNFNNASAGTGTTYTGSGASVDYRPGGNRGFLGVVTATTAGTNTGATGVASGGVANVGVWGASTIAKNSATNVGVAGFGLNTGSSPVQVGGFFALQDNSSSAPSYASAALLADNGSQTSPIFLARDNGTAVFTIADGGDLQIARTITAIGTTGAQTINKASGTVNVAAAGTSVIVTNSLVTANSLVYCVIRTADATATQITSVVPTSGSFTITLNAAATATVSIGFLVTN